jgi:hypothetical protein
MIVDVEWRSMAVAAITLCVGMVVVGCADSESSDVSMSDVSTSDVGGDPEAGSIAETCPDFTPLRQALFGELHVHTRLSFDGFAWDAQNGPGEAYSYARGAASFIPPLDASGHATRQSKLDRPLDFTAVTEHAELLGEVRICSGSNDSDRCRRARGEVRVPGLPDWGSRVRAFLPYAHPPELCGPDGSLCQKMSGEVWKEIQDAAAAWNDRCSFSTFVGYEYSANSSTTLHRNIIFRGASVPDAPITYLDAPTPLELWTQLQSKCLDAATGCDVLSIPHNSNHSNGNMFAPLYPGTTSEEEQLAQARLRARLEPLVEVFQHKGDSECRNGLSGVEGRPDELCDFEKVYALDGIDDCGDGVGAGGGAVEGCVSRFNFVRYVLSEGLVEQERLGVNPYRLGMVAGTDDHSGAPGMVSERRFAGHWGLTDADLESRLAFPAWNPGGLTGVWAEENSRDSIFDALKRRETFATSGPRMRVRFFAGWALDRELCEAPDAVSRAYASGVPMGGELRTASNQAGEALRFFVSALADPGSPNEPAVPLQRIQIVKGWADPDGTLHQQVFDVAGGSGSDARVDLDTCESVGEGAQSLCAVWEDPNFVHDRTAVYYARVLENPRCRWNARQCLDVAPEDRPSACESPTESSAESAAESLAESAALPKTSQERAWTSPIWYSPTGR